MTRVRLACSTYHPEAADIAEESLLHGPVDYIPPNVYDLIDEEMIYNSASKTKGSAWPSGMDSELYRRILCSKNFKTEGKILREEIAVFTTGGPSSSCEMIILRNNSHGGIIRVCMGIFTTALRNKKIRQILKKNTSPRFHSVLLVI